MLAARKYCASHAAVRCVASTSPDAGVKPASYMFDVTFGGTASA